ncbi:MAG: nucleotidyltransferase domain-containing protein [Chitinophagaceae bacterium]
MTLEPVFPTALHEEAAKIVRDYFLKIPDVDTVLLVNSCARGQAVPESDLDFAILVKNGMEPTGIKSMETGWQFYAGKQPVILKYRQSNQFAQLHLDIIDGHYSPAIPEVGVGPDFFEIEIGNQICYSAPMDNAGTYFHELQKKWLPYYDEKLRLQRFAMTKNACEYDLDHIPFFINRGLYFQAFDILYKAFQEYLQALFIANKTYPIAYNKWIKEQMVKWLNKPALYPKLSPILSVSNIESNEINEKAIMLRELLNNLTIE